MTQSDKIVSTHLFRIRFKLEDRHLRASVSGYGGSVETTIAYWNAIGEEVREVRPQSLLVIDQMDGGPMPADHVPQFIDAMSGHGFEGMRIAYVEAHVDQLAQAEVAEILACEKGFNVRVFCNEMDAAVWLRHGEI
ncbi:MAG: hypothetical protein ACREPE_11000 [Lysobacter sp.]